MSSRQVSTRILIVDDDDDDIYLISDTLQEIEERHIDIHVERSPSAGIKALAQHSFDVALCDFKLGAMSGIDVIKTARAEEIDTPIILLTGVGNKAIDQAALEAGAADFLAKDTICRHRWIAQFAMLLPTTRASSCCRPWSTMQMPRCWL